MVKQLLDEVRAAPLDDAQPGTADRHLQDSPWTSSPTRCRPTSETSSRVRACRSTGGTPPSDAELRVAQAQLVGWLEGLFHGIQATLFAQQMAAQQQLQQMRGPAPARGQPGQMQRGPDVDNRPGTYL